MRQNKKNNQKGFSLLEMIITMGIFSIVAIAVVSVFASVVFYQKKTRQQQKDLEAARAGMENISKTIRMSSDIIVDSGTGTITMFNNSENKCVKYRFDAVGLLKDEKSIISDPSECANLSSGYTASFYIIPDAIGDFTIVPSDPTKAGKATITIEVGGMQMQTTVSLRDYSESF